MLKPLRSLSGFLDFECAARWGSFKLAAKELHKTPAAVSQQIKHLEEQLGFSLFVRQPRQITLTEKGRSLAATLGRCLGDIGDTIDQLRSGDNDKVVRISITHSLSMKWLVPRLADFSRLHPDIDLRVEASDEIVDLDRGTVDIALRTSDRQHDGNAIQLGCEELVAVYSPSLEQGRRALTSDSLNQLPLLYQQTPEEWIKWLQHNDLLRGQQDFSQNFSHSGILVQAAVAGQGLALAPYIIAAEDLRLGNLKLLPGKPLRTACRYYAISAPEQLHNPNAKLVCAWLKDQFDECNATGPN